MKLLFVLPEYLPHAGGGIITFYRMLLPRLVAMGHHVRVIIGSGVFSQPAAPPVQIDGVQVEMLDSALCDKYLSRFSCYAATPGLGRYLAAAWALHEQAGRGEGYDLVETTDWGLLFLPWVLEPGPPVVVQMHGSGGQIEMHDPVAGEELQGQLLRLIERQGIALADRVQSYSRANAEFWRAQASREVEFIPPAWASLVGESASAPRSKRGLVVGRVQRWKGPQVLCEAMQLLGERAPGIDWMGRDTVYEDRTTSTSAHLAKTYPDIWNRRLVHQPQQPFEQTARLQAQAAFVVVPSTWDVFNFTCIEAMGAGTPVICSTGAGASQMIDDGINGFVFDNEDASSLAAAMGRFLALTPPQRETLAAAGQATILSELDPDKVGWRRLQSYREVVAAPRQCARPDDWLRRACMPQDAPIGGLGFLDQLPLKPLVNYVWRRSLDKLVG